MRNQYTYEVTNQQGITKKFNKIFDAGLEVGVSAYALNDSTTFTIYREFGLKPPLKGDFFIKFNGYTVHRYAKISGHSPVVLDLHLDPVGGEEWIDVQRIFLDKLSIKFGINFNEIRDVRSFMYPQDNSIIRRDDAVITQSALNILVNIRNIWAHDGEHASVLIPVGIELMNEIIKEL